MINVSRHIPRGVLAAVAAVVVLAGVGVAVLTLNHSGSSHQKIKAAGKGQLPLATLRVEHLHHGRVHYAKRLRLHVVNGVLSSVSVRDQSGAGAIDGTFNKTRTRWHSSHPLAPSLQLRAAVSYVDLAHKTIRRTLHVSTPAAKQHVNALLSPGGGDTVGVGSPVVVTFSRPVPENKRAEVEAGLSVKATPSVVGAWHWMSDQEVHWRPPSYWKPGTKVQISSDLQDVDFGHGAWGAVGHHQTSFVIGPSHISEVDIANHEMYVYNNGRLIKTFPDSTGRASLPTMDGVHIAIEKSRVVDMNSATVGIPQGSPGYYNELVYWDVRISDGGEFVHAAPWSVAEQGHINVSHGCVNLSPANAEWFYNWSLRGDVIDVYDGVRPPSATDPGTADWNMSWKKWLAGDAAPSAAALALHPRLPHTYEPRFAPTHHKHSSSGKKHHHKKQH
ncbi:MAG TPA: Ig-like domain-containing protein [Mycobacteriales bacterium]|nr:Ig-like domain-containing protein [Mycobacteriales bacterium]